MVDLFVGVIRNDQTTTQLGEGGMSSSRLGFRGVEDLGGGLKASFWLEGALGPDTGLGGASFGNSSRTTNAYAFERRSTLSLSNQWGEVRLGRDYTPTNKWIVFGHHFAAIAGPGPLVGPTLAAQFGFLPGALWIIVGVAGMRLRMASNSGRQSSFVSSRVVRTYPARPDA